ncbi:MAG TPA: hypothetical protein VNO84_04385 [Burkholderiaceae bacterium]|nr:hypothetical protein [Burkholderiaceae bacterium]
MSDCTESLRRRRFLLSLAGAAGLGVAGGCATLAPPSIDISAAQLLDAMGRQFPLNIKALEALDLVVAAPRLRFLPQENRLATELDLRIAQSWLGRAVQGIVGFSYGLRYEASDRSVRMTDLRVDRLDAGSFSLGQSAGARLAAVLTQQFLRDLVVYRLKPEQVDVLQRFRVQPGEVRVRPQGLSIALQPMR